MNKNGCYRISPGAIIDFSVVYQVNFILNGEMYQFKSNMKHQCCTSKKRM